MKSKVLITGSQGFIGKLLVNKLKKEYKLLLIDKKINKNHQKNFHKINLLNLEELNEFFYHNKVNCIIHLASEIFDNDKNVYSHNLLASKNLFLMAKKYKIKNIIFTSTFSIYEKNYSKPILETQPPSAKNSYGRSKYEIEKLLILSKIKNFTILRVPIVVGKSRSHRIGILFELIRNNIPLILINDGNNRIQFTSVEYLTRVIRKCIKLKNKNIFNIGTKKSYTFKENLSYLIEKSKSNSKIIGINKTFGNLILNVLIFLKLIFINFYHKVLLTKNITLNTKKIKKSLKIKSDNSSKEIL